MSWKDRESGIWQLYPSIGRFVLGYNSTMTGAESPNQTSNEKQNLRAAGYMLAAVLAYSLTPVFIHAGESHQSPFMYSAIRTLTGGIGIIVFLIVFYHRQLLDIDTWRAVGKNWRRWSLLGVLVSLFDQAVLGWSLKYIDVSIAGVLFGTWTIWVIILTGQIFKGENRYEVVSVFAWICILMGFAGLGFVIFSQTGGVNSEGNAISPPDIILGVFFALLAAGIAALASAGSIRWSITVLKDVPEQKRGQTEEDIKKMELFFGLVGIAIASIPGIIIGVSWGIWGAHNEIIKTDNMLFAAAQGLIAAVIGRICFRKANFTTTKLELNALTYATPVLGLIWLGMLGYINVPRIDWLVIGATGIIAANALLNFKAERRLAYQSLVVSLWVCGVVIYFRPIWGAPVFYESMTLVATLFILILSFRIDRLVRRTSEEDEMTMDIMQQISSFPKNMQNKLRNIDEADSPKKLKDAYDAFKRTLEEEHPEKAPPESDKELAALMRKVNNLAHSKQQGANFGEQAVLWILGGICAGGLLAFMPEGITEKYGIGGFFLETVAFLIAATVIFLLFNIQDLQGDRSRQMIERESDTGDTRKSRAFTGIVFREIHDRVAEKWISIIFCVVIITTFAILFWRKWIPA